MDKEHEEHFDAYREMGWIEDSSISRKDLEQGINISLPKGFTAKVEMSFNRYVGRDGYRITLMKDSRETDVFCAIMKITLPSWLARNLMLSYKARIRSTCPPSY